MRRNGTEEDDEVHRLLNLVLKYRKNRIKFHHVEGWLNLVRLGSLFSATGPLTTLYQRSQASGFRGDLGKTQSCILMCHELFPSKEAFQFDPSKLATPVEWVSAESQALVWMAKVRNTYAIAMAFDGRDKAARRQIEDWVEENTTDNIVPCRNN